MSGHTYTHTHIHIIIHTGQLTLAAHARRGLIIMCTYITSARGHELSGRVCAHAYNYYAWAECAWVAK